MPKIVSKEDINSRLENRKIQLIGEYISSKTKTHFLCLICNHKWEERTDNILHGYKCPECFKIKIAINKSNRKIHTPKNYWSNERIDHSLLERKIVRVSDFSGYFQKIKFECDSNHQWDSTINDVIIKGKGCPYCYKLRKLLTNDIVDKRLENRNIKRVSDFINSGTKMKWKCLSCECEWDARSCSIFSGHGCPNCRYKNETRIRKYLIEKYGNSNVTKKTLKIKGKWYYIDFVVNDVFIEYNGQQHYAPVEYWGGENSLIKQQIRDNIIREYCLTNNIRLIEIPYWLSHEDQYKLLENLH